MQAGLGAGRSRAAWTRCARSRGALIGALWLLGSGVALAGVGGAAVAAGAPGAGAFGVRSASLTQDGQQLRWHVALGHDFAGSAFARGRRTLCLLIESGRSGAVTGQLCVAPPRGASGKMRLTFAPVTRTGTGRAVAVPATITRGGRDELTAEFLPAAFDPSYRSLHWQVQSTYRAAACSSSNPAGGQTTPGGQTTTGQTTTGQTTTAPVAPTCTLVFPVRPALARLHTPKLVGCVAGGPSIVYSGPPTRHEIALTFDDGPWYTPPSIQFVDLLARYHVPATFFEIGNQIPQYDPTGSIERTMLADGDMIGDHTWTHPDMTKLSPAQQTSQLQMTADAIRHATGFRPCLWRPPYGALNRPLVSLARQLNFTTIYWNVDTRDWSLPGTGAIEQAALSGAANGGIILMHFGGGPRYETYDALPTIITTLRRRGYQFVNVAQLLGLRMIYR